jgi:hypothetical protein
MIFGYAIEVFVAIFVVAFVVGVVALWVLSLSTLNRRARMWWAAVFVVSGVVELVLTRSRVRSDWSLLFMNLVWVLIGLTSLVMDVFVRKKANQ